MAEKVYKSPGVFTIEVDKTVQEAVSTISGIPAGVIGTSNQGQAFVPITVGTFKEFEDYFGSVTEARNEATSLWCSRCQRVA